MTKTVHPVLKKTGAVLLTVLVLVLMAVPALAVALPDAPTGYVYDGANVLSSSTESYIERTGSALAEACGAEVVVATVDFTDGEDIADYAYDLFNKWGIGDKRANNGLLILLSVGAEDYYAEPGVGLTDVFTGGVLDAMLYDYLEDDFAAKEYDSGVKKVYARAVEILEDHYNVSYSTGTTNNANANTDYNYANNNPSGGFLSGVQNVFFASETCCGYPDNTFCFHRSVRHFDYCAERAVSAQTVLPQRLGCAAPAASDGRLLARTPSAARPGRSRIRRPETGWI